MDGARCNPFNGCSVWNPGGSPGGTTGRPQGRNDMPAIRDGDHILVIDRKLFHDDNTRFFVGVVEEYDDRVVRLRGFPFHLSPYEVTGVALGN